MTWWNDLLINIPIAYGFGYLFSLLSESLFLPFMIIFYRVTNIVGLFLLHRGIEIVVRKEGHKYGRKELTKDIIISVGYTALIVALGLSGILRLPGDYLPGEP